MKERRKACPKLVFGKRRISISEAELKALEEAYQAYVSLSGAPLGFVFFLLGGGQAMRFIPDYPLENLEPAPYNPRKIGPAAFARLQESLRRFGVIKPLVLNGPARIAAGHQRAKALKAMRVATCPAILLDQVAKDDEIKFNLFHNRVETGHSPARVEGAAALPLGFSPVRHHQLQAPDNRNSGVVTEIGLLIQKYGPWGCLVIDEAGEVLEASDYAVAASLLKQDVLVCKVPDRQAKAVRAFLAGDYGSYHFEPLAVKPYNQRYCQMARLTGSRKQNRSQVYERLVLPRLQEAERLVDFGAGKCGYVDRLRARGRPVFAYEPHFAPEGRIDKERVAGMIQEIEAEVRARGLFEAVVLDGVLNSITSEKFERLVLTACNALLRADGWLALGTRNLKHPLTMERARTRSHTERRYLEFLDDRNFSVSYRGNGLWTLQKFHTRESLAALLEPYFGQVEFKASKGDFHVICTRPRTLPLEDVKEALEIEFNMELPGGHRPNVHHGLVACLLERLRERAVTPPERQ